MARARCETSPTRAKTRLIKRILLRGDRERQMARRQSDVAAAATRALLKGAKWVEANPRLAAMMAVEKKYLASNSGAEHDGDRAICVTCRVSGGGEGGPLCRQRNESREACSARTPMCRSAGETAFVHLEGVTDEWIETWRSKKSPAAQVRRRRYSPNGVPDPEGHRGFMLPKTNVRSPDQDAPNLADPDAPCLSRDDDRPRMNGVQESQDRKFLLVDDVRQWERAVAVGVRPFLMESRPQAPPVRTSLRTLLTFALAVAVAARCPSACLQK